MNKTIEAESMPLEIVWRNPLTFVRAHLTVKKSSDPYYPVGRASQKDPDTSGQLEPESQVGSMNSTDIES